MPMKTIDEQREYGRIWRTARRAKWIKENGPCKICGSNIRLEVDHIDPSTKLIATRNIWGLSETKRLEELIKCQVLCYKCHREKTGLEQSNSPHGSYNRYRSWGCRCRDCKDANTIVKRAYRAKKKDN